MRQPLVIQTEDLDAQAAAWLGERCELIRCAPDEARFGELLGRAAGLVVRTYTQVDEGMLSRAHALKVVGRAGVGLENIDVEACRRRGIAVVHTPESNTSAVAEYVFAMMLDALRPRLYLGVERAAGGDARPTETGSLKGRPTGDRQANLKGRPTGPRACARSLGVPSREEWHVLRRQYVAALELNEMVLGIWGMGRIGQAVARIAGGFGMRVIYNDLVEIGAEKRWGGEPVSVDELLAQSVVLSVHVDERAGNRGLVSAAALGRVKKDVLLINTSRGFVVDAGALAAFLRANPGAGAMLDVHEPEPIEAGYPLLGVGNAWLAPHLASGTVSAKRRMSWVVREVWGVLGEETERGRDGESEVP